MKRRDGSFANAVRAFDSRIWVRSEEVTPRSGVAAAMAAEVAPHVTLRAAVRRLSNVAVPDGLGTAHAQDDGPRIDAIASAMACRRVCS